MKQNRFKSWALWSSVAALIVLCVKDLVGIEISYKVNEVLDVLLSVLVAFGILNNPTDHDNF